MHPARAAAEHAFRERAAAEYATHVAELDAIFGAEPATETPEKASLRAQLGVLRDQLGAAKEIARDVFGVRWPEYVIATRACDALRIAELEAVRA